MHGTHPQSGRYTFGPIVDTGGTLFRLWAPLVEKVTLKLCTSDQRVDMERGEEGWFEVYMEGITGDELYLFVLPDGTEVPDPASRYQPHGVTGPSMVWNPAFSWTDTDWRGRPWEEAVIYELHVGTFTAQGTFRAAIERLDALADLGVTAIEILPVNAFPGRWGWGYDGVCLYAPHAAYGTPDEFRAFVDAAHARNLMVLLDVVYNHFGPQGNLMPSFMPLLSRRHEGEFGTPPNLDDHDSGPVRDLLIENALYWLECFHCDGLRLDAAHDMTDTSQRHILTEIGETIRSRFEGRRRVHLILENSLNQARWLDGPESPAPYTAQWDDDIHHGLHVAVSGERIGFYRAYHHPFEMLARALAEGFAFQGVTLEDGRIKGEPSAHLPPTAFIAYMQNHDQIGNRPDGTRISGVLAPKQVRAMASVVLLSPTIPMLFMGEEWAASTRFCYFSDLEERLRDAMRQSRLDFLATWDMLDTPVPDPFDPETFASSTLDWSEADQGTHARWREFYRKLIEIRMREIVPRLPGIGGHAGKAERIGQTALVARWRLGDGTTLQLMANLGPQRWEGAIADAGRTIWTTGAAAPGWLDPWSVTVAIAD